MTEAMEKYIPFVASLTYGIDEEDEGPMTVEDAQYTMDQWAEEGSIEVPEGFTAEIFSAIWSEWYPGKPENQDQEDEFIIGNPELSFEISECGHPIDDVIEKVEREYPGWKFSRTEARYQSCIMAIFEKC